jgi:hypothetical protein
LVFGFTMQPAATRAEYIPGGNYMSLVRGTFSICYLYMPSPIVMMRPKMSSFEKPACQFLNAAMGGLHRKPQPLPPGNEAKSR